MTTIVKGLSTVRREKRKKSKISRIIREKAIEFSKDLKERATPAEQLLYARLKELGIFFQFQRPAPKGTYKHGFFIPDFTFKGNHCKVFVEIDGSSHIGKEKYDAMRDRKLVGLYRNKILHYTNKEVFENVDNVVRSICKYIKQQVISESPLRPPVLVQD